MTRATLLASLLLAAPLASGDALDAERVLDHFRERLDGVHFRARVELSIHRAGDSEKRVVELWRDDREGARKRLAAVIRAPEDLRGVSLLFLEHPVEPNEYFLFTPATGRLRTLPESFARQEVYGVDFDSLGFGVAAREAARVEDFELTSHAGRPAYYTSLRALVPGGSYDVRRLWLDAESFAPLRVVYEREGVRTLESETLSLDYVQGIATPTRVRVERPSAGETVEIRVESIDYQQPIPERRFTTAAMAAP